MGEELWDKGSYPKSELTLAKEIIFQHYRVHILMKIFLDKKKVILIKRLNLKIIKID